jgi:hypothetical protein
MARANGAGHPLLQPSLSELCYEYRCVRSKSRNLTLPPHLTDRDPRLCPRTYLRQLIDAFETAAEAKNDVVAETMSLLKPGYDEGLIRASAGLLEGRDSITIFLDRLFPGFDDGEAAAREIEPPSDLFFRPRLQPSFPLSPASEPTRKRRQRQPTE